MPKAFPRILIQNNSFQKIPHFLEKYGCDFAIVTDSNLKKRGEELLKAIRASELRCNLLIVPSGEKTKSLHMIEKLAQSLLSLGLKRDSCLIGLGGGVIGDITGFLAAIYMRGINYVSVPTTLLAMGDSSIGGKTGVDLPEGKNLLGAFYHPELVIMDPLLLESLPERDFRNGLAEIVKHAVIASSKFFTFLEKHAVAILKRTPTLLQKIVRESVRIKLAIVKKDEREEFVKTKSGVSRMLVNYGHTVGHALEKLSNYTIPHGEAVAIGMAAENRLAVGKGFLKEKDAKRIEELLKKFHLPTKIPVYYSDASLKKAMKMDKKHVDGKLYFALPRRIGSAALLTFDL